jgi:hypothetical protein
LKHNFNKELFSLQLSLLAKQVQSLFYIDKSS